MAHLPNPNAALTQPTDPSANPNASLTRKVGSYRLVLETTPVRIARTLCETWIAYCHVYRNDLLVTQVRASDSETAVREARRNVRNARKAGGL